MSAESIKPSHDRREHLRGERWPVSSAVGMRQFYARSRPGDKYLAGTLEAALAQEVGKREGGSKTAPALD